MQEGRLNCCKEPSISAVHGAGDVRGVWCWQRILRMTPWRLLCLPLGAFLSQFLMRSPVYIHLRRERKAFSPVASLSGKLRKSLHDHPVGHKCFCTETSRCSVCPEASPGPSLLLLLLQAGQRHQALGKAAPHIHPWYSTRGELQPWLS